jgi:hypothetical protein
VLRTVGVGLLCGCLAGLAVAAATHLGNIRQIEKIEGETALIEADLAPLGEGRKLVARIRELSSERRVMTDIIDELLTKRIDVLELDRTLIDAATRAGVTLEQAAWHNREVLITVRAVTAENLVNFAIHCSDATNLAGLEIKQWDGEDLSDQFVLTATWRSPPTED